MTAKRLLTDSNSSGPDEPKEKRMRPRLSFASVIGEAVMINCLRNALEPVLRRVVSEEVEISLSSRLRSISRSPSLRIQAPEPSTFQLMFRKNVSSPIFSGSKILDEESNQLQVFLVDTRAGQLVPVLFSNPIKVDIVVLDGDFPSGDGNNWTSEEFEKNIIKERTGKRPLLAGELAITVREGVGSIGDIEFTDNSSWIRSRKFRIGAKVSQGSSQNVLIREAMTQAFVVKDHRGELYKKHHPPMLGDEVWRLEKIGKDGKFHKRLAAKGVETVQDFLKMSVIDPCKLRSILGPGMSEKVWDVTFKHAKTCVIGNKQYVFRRWNDKIFLNPICQLMKAEINGRVYPTYNLSNINRAYLENLVREAYANWSSLEEIEVISNEIGLLIQRDHGMVDQFPSCQQTMVRSFQQNAYLPNGTSEAYMPSEMQENHSNNWQTSQANFDAEVQNGFRLDILEVNSDDDLTSPRSFITAG